MLYTIARVCTDRTDDIWSYICGTCIQNCLWSPEVTGAGAIPAARPRSLCIFSNSAVAAWEPGAERVRGYRWRFMKASVLYRIWFMDQMHSSNFDLFINLRWTKPCKLRSNHHHSVGQGSTASQSLSWHAAIIYIDLNPKSGSGRVKVHKRNHYMSRFCSSWQKHPLAEIRVCARLTVFAAVCGVFALVLRTSSGRFLRQIWLNFLNLAVKRLN